MFPDAYVVPVWCIVTPLRRRFFLVFFLFCDFGHPKPIFHTETLVWPKIFSPAAQNFRLRREVSLIDTPTLTNPVSDLMIFGGGSFCHVLPEVMDSWTPLSTILFPYLGP